MLYSMNYYELLGVDAKDNNDTLKKAYRKKAIEWHPDVNKSPSASNMFKEIKMLMILYPIMAEDLYMIEVLM